MRRLALILALVLTASSVPARAAQYPPSYEWKTITTEHFEVHYHQGEELLAERAAAICEAIHPRVTSLFGWMPKGRTHLVLTDNVDVSNGSATPFPYNRMEVYVSAPGADPSSSLAFYDDWLAMVITHEYAHIVHLDQARGVNATLRRIFGRNPIAFPNQLMPAWMIEGIATLVESELTEAGRVKGTFLDMVLRTAAIEGRFATEPQAAGLTPDWPGGNRRYLYGAAFLDWLARTRGLENLRDYFLNYADDVIPYRVNATARETWGRSLRSLWREWSAAAQAEYRREGEWIRAEGLTDAERLTDLGYETLHGSLSPDGTRLAYGHRGPFEYPTIRIRDIGGGRDLASLKVNTLSQLSWSPDGTRIAFAQLEFDGPFRLLSDIYVWEIGRGEARRLTRGARLKSPAFTPDGGTIIAVQNEGGRNRIVALDLASASIEPIVVPDDLRQFSEPVVNPDGSRIAVAEWQEGRIDIVLYDRRGARIRNLTRSLPKSISASPRFSGDGATIFFSSDVTGIPNVASVPAEGGPITRLTNLYGGGFFPAPAPDGSIYYSDYSSRGFDLARFIPDREWPLVPRPLPQSIVAENVIAPPQSISVDSAVRDYSPWPTLAPRWWFPIIGAATSGETGAGILTSGNDVLGFHSWMAQVVATAGGDGEVDYLLSYSYDRLWPTITLAGLRYADDSAVAFRVGEESVVYRERIQRTLAQAAFPFRRYRWQTEAIVGAFRESVASDTDLDVPADVLAGLGLFEGTLNGWRAALTFNNARQFGYSLSPENGVTALLDLQALTGARELEQLRTEFRGYLSIPVRRSPLGRHVVAGRVAAGFTEGDFLLERELKAGGVGSEGFVTVNATHFPVRGFETGTLRGRDAMLVSLEYRFPLFNIDRGPSTWPLFFHRIFADVFYDTATVWNREAVALPRLQRPESDPFSDDNTLASAGAELSIDLFLAYYVPLRYRLGAAVVLDAPPCRFEECRSEGDVQLYVAVGRSF